MASSSSGFVGIRGFYLLNASLRRFGLREVPRLPREPAPHSVDTPLAFVKPGIRKRSH